MKFRDDKVQAFAALDAWVRYGDTEVVISDSETPPVLIKDTSTLLHINVNEPHKTDDVMLYSYDMSTYLLRFQWAEQRDAWHQIIERYAQPEAEPVPEPTAAESDGPEPEPEPEPASTELSAAAKEEAALAADE